MASYFMSESGHIFMSRRRVKIQFASGNNIAIFHDEGNWRASKASKTLSGLFNRESRL